MSEYPPTGEWPAPDATQAADVGPWPTIPGFEILRELGRGGMGVVYKARQTSSNRFVALKLIRDSALAGPQERGRFRIEAEAAARMRHPNIVQIYQVGEHEGRPYFAMELVEGGGLDRRLAGQPQAPEEAAKLVRTVALAVQHAHEQKIVHRDLKPANILLQRSEVRGQKSEVGSQQSQQGQSSSSDLCPLISDLCPKITDFSLAKRLDTDSTAWTRDGDVLGTANYMAPEQAAGRVTEIGPAVDIYALGAILYELLTGRPPFQADSWNQTVQRVLLDEPVPPWQLRPGLPRDLETVCLKCLEKEPVRRYASALELAEDLERFLKGEPVAAVPLGARERLARVAARDGYQIVDEIGRGPRSVVYHALSGPLQQAVAVKVFAAGMCTREEWEARLRRAADLRAPLTHPSIVPVHGAGWWDGSPYLALEHVPHRSLADKLTGRPYSILEALRLLEQLAEIVSYLHRQGVMHGNLKPSNILLAATDIPRIVDIHLTSGLFQISLHPDDPPPAGLGYLAPEQLESRLESASARPDAELRPYTDIYGLGTILYELLTGRPPYTGTTVRAIVEQIAGHDPVPPSRLNSKVTLGIESCCLRCLRKNPWRRYHRVYDFIRRLRSLLDELRSGGSKEKAAENPT
jgi:serine/threonine protein kinase